MEIKNQKNHSLRPWQINCDFSYRHYFEVLKHAKKTHQIFPIGEFREAKKHDQFILLRHDVDISLTSALHLAKLENKEKIRSTFYILLHSQFYNALSEPNRDIIKQISSLGHEIGLHYDTTFFSKNADTAKKQITNELSILSSIVDKKIKTAVRHNPSVTPDSKLSIPQNLINPMSKQFRKEIFYISDSVQNWRSKCMCNHISTKEKLHILTHPIWWSKESYSRISIYNKFFKSVTSENKHEINKVKRMHNDYLNLLK